jgi:hypothetical protein
MDWTQVILTALAILAPIVGAFAYSWRRRSDARFREMNARITETEMRSQKELEQVKSSAATALAVHESIKTLANAMASLVDERRESTVATKENTEQLKNLSVRMGDQDERMRLFFQAFGANLTAFNLDVGNGIKALQTATSEAIQLLISTVNGMMPQVAGSVAPVLTKLDNLIGEVQRTSDAATTGRENVAAVLTREIHDSRNKILAEVAHLSQVIHAAILIENPDYSPTQIEMSPEEPYLSESVKLQPAGV